MPISGRAILPSSARSSLTRKFVTQVTQRGLAIRPSPLKRHSVGPWRCISITDTGKTEILVQTNLETHKALFERSLKVSPGGVHSPVRSFKNMGVGPLFFKATNGAYIEDVCGVKYIDFCQSFGPMILGHRDADVQKEVIEMINTAWTFGAPEPYSLELAEWITKRVPAAEKVRFVSSGTEAVMSALRVARAATKRDLVLKFDGCYHGHFDSLLVQSGSGLAGEASSSSAGISPTTAAQTLVCPLDDEATLHRIFETHGHEIACVALEPLPANYGLLPQRPEFLQKVVELAKAHGALVLFDEVISGFRVALGGM
ncbi:MAG: aminotransferase class III-fold pyridoxal phosphate-dependent enzyme, partial [Proteobacteria bacterium]